MSSVQARTTGSVATGNSSTIDGKFVNADEFELTTTQRGKKTTKTYSVTKAENGLVVEKHIKFWGKTIGKYRVSPRSALFRSEGKKVYTAIAKNYLKGDFNNLNNDGVEDQNAAQVCNIKRLMTKFNTPAAVIGLVADLPPQEGAKLLVWCAQNPNELPKPLSQSVKNNPSKFVSSCIECAVKNGYGSGNSPYNSEVNPDAQAKYSDLMAGITYYDDNLAINALNTLNLGSPDMRGSVKHLAGVTFSEIARTHKYEIGYTTMLSKLGHLNSKEVRNSTREHPAVFLKLLPELQEVSLNNESLNKLSQTARESYGESLSQYGNALLEHNHTAQHPYITDSLSSSNVDFNYQNMLRLYDSFNSVNDSQKVAFHTSLLKHPNIPSTLKYLSAMDSRRNNLGEKDKQQGVYSDFKVFVGARETGDTFSADRERLQAFVNSPDISPEQKTRCFRELPLGIVSQIAENKMGDYYAHCANIANEVANLRFINEQQRHSNGQVPAGELQLRDNRQAAPQVQTQAVNHGVFSNTHVLYDTTNVRQQLEAASRDINQFMGVLIPSLSRRNRVDHQHREGFREL
ncbi:hypothetical protein SOPP22_07175 [Shewanella sp. OPT22]|nr:hypothetical protein SOPP22_07175 [Shewanella sp. OPT22]